ncbi:DUF3426 domain-containing protein [Marinomonas dokdonensis]|uniref:DUF3426 domain-containing protein n=1 Tax=Marinomonas dokdonensis TaxID=328224 RepID=UPI0040557CC1
MSTSLITRCPKCSTAFRVSDEVLSMAKGKVRCGQCFHIFDAQKHQKKTTTSVSPSTSLSPKPTSETEVKRPVETTAEQSQPVDSLVENDTSPEAPSSTPAKALESEIELEDLPVNPDWLNTLFDDEDDNKPSSTEAASPAPSKPAAAQVSILDKVPAAKQAAKSDSELAPWEVELAEVEAALSAAPKPVPTPPKKPQPSPEALFQPSDLDVPVKQAQPEPEPEPDYMQALHTLAQTASTKQAKPADQHTILEQLSAHQNLAPLLDEEESAQKKNKSALAWLWVIGVLVGGLLLAGQVTMHFFEAGSHSTTFRSFYRTICTYTDCTLPAFEDTKAISIQHVRIQSHPSQANVLLVNAILTNTSPFSQAMPKVALEFFDLNGAPVAARLFAPNDYLHKDFLDITYMPPSTPIHVVIPIQDPGARAVTHQLKALPAGTGSF